MVIAGQILSILGTISIVSAFLSHFEDIYIFGWKTAWELNSDFKFLIIIGVLAFVIGVIMLIVLDDYEDEYYDDDEDGVNTDSYLSVKANGRHNNRCPAPMINDRKVVTDGKVGVNNVIAHKPVNYGSEKGKLQCLSGELKGFSINMEDGEKVTIGRNKATCNVLMSDANRKISGTHCSVSYIRSNDKYIIEDVSTNGTYVKIKSDFEKISKRTVLADRGTVFSLDKEHTSIFLLG